MIIFTSPTFFEKYFFFLLWLRRYTLGIFARWLIARAQRRRYDPRLYEYLKWRYQAYPLLTRAGNTYPVAIYAIDPDEAPGRWVAQRDDPDSILPQRHDHGRLFQSQKEETIPNADRVEIRDGQLRRWMTWAGYFRDPHLSRATFALDRMVSSDRLELYTYLGGYFENYDSCDSLEWELLRSIGRLKELDVDSLTRFDGSLPLRSALHERVSSPARDGRFRCAGIAISTLIAYEHEEYGLELLLRKRSTTTVAAHPGGTHVIPSFMFQPGTTDLIGEYSVVHNIYREYLEELFNRPEPESDNPSARYFYDDERLAFLFRLMDEGQAKLYLTGYVMNLLSMRPEICTLLHIKSPSWWSTHEKKFKDKDERFHFCDEFAGIENQKGLVGSIPYSDSDEELIAHWSLQVPNIVPSGAAAFWLGVDTLRKVRANSDSTRSQAPKI